MGALKQVPRLFLAMSWLVGQAKAAPESPPWLMQNVTSLPARQLLATCPSGFSPPGAASAGCSAAKPPLCCCYSPTWWLSLQPVPVVTCLSGKFSGPTPQADKVLNSCQFDNTGPGGQVSCGGITCSSVPNNCDYTEYPGDAVSSRYNQGPATCETNLWNGKTLLVYSRDNLYPDNNEVVWADLSTPSSEKTGVQNCGGSQSASFQVTGTFTTTTGWNIGGQAGLKIPGSFLSKIAPELKLTGGYTRTTSTGTNTGVTVNVPPNFHGTATGGTLVHHSYGYWIVTGSFQGCSKIKVDKVASDTPVASGNPYIPSDFGTEVKPCGYPLLNGNIN